MTHAQIRILTLVFDGSFLVVGLAVISTMGARYRNSAWRSHLKTAWIALVLATCLRSLFRFASMGTGGKVVVALSWYRTRHGGWAAWWVGW